MTVKETPMFGPTPIVFDRPVVVLVEGPDDRALTARLIESFHPGDSWHVHHMQGNSTDWVGLLGVLLNSDDFQDSGVAIGLVLDADLDVAAAADKARGYFRAAGLPVPTNHGLVTSGAPRTGFFLMPNGQDTGAVEELVLTAVDSDRRQLAERYISDVAARHGEPKKPVKAVVQAYLAGQYDHVKTLPVAVRSRSVVDVTSPPFTPYRDFLSLLSGTPIPPVT